MSRQDAAYDLRFRHLVAADAAHRSRRQNLRLRLDALRLVVVSERLVAECRAVQRGAGGQTPVRR